MPIHRVAAARLHEELQRIARDGEHIDHVLTDPKDPEFYVVTTTDEVIELRGAAL
jgi:hypothetical protein